MRTALSSSIETVFVLLIAAAATGAAPSPPKVPPDERGQVEFAHPPFAQAVCGTCHLWDDLKDPGPARPAQSDICFTCHVGLLNRTSTARYLHEPFVKNCQHCHNPHNSDFPGLLNAQAQELCTSCHKPIEKLLSRAKVQHGAISRKKSCTNCHDPHGGNYKYQLRSESYDLCIRCHSVDTFKDKHGNKMLNFKEHFEQNPNRHAPVADKECSSCHQPHGAAVQRLLIDPYPATFYTGYKGQKYALCYECHAREIIEAPTTTRTGFRNKEKNEHYAHVVRPELGRSCRACHAVHASKQAFHIRESVPYGTSGWELKLNFSPTQDGGTCEKTCHETRPYHRGEDARAPGQPIRNRRLRDHRGVDTPLLDDRQVTVLFFMRPDQTFSRLTLKELEACRGYLEDKPVRFVAVVPDRFGPAAVRRTLAAAGSDLTALLDRDAALEVELGVKAHPQFLVIDPGGRVVAEQTISKTNTCAPLVQRIRYALNEISAQELAAALDPPPEEEKTDNGLLDRYIGLATVLLRHKLYDKAQTAVDLALKQDPASGAAHAVLRAIHTARGDRPQLESARAPQGITVDGELVEFRNARPLQLRAGDASAKFWVEWDAKALHVAAHVDDADLWVRGRGRDGPLREADGIEILIDPLLGRKEAADQTVRQIVVTAAGDLLDATGAGEAASLKADKAVTHAVVVHGTISDFHQDTGYDVELSIPWADLEVTPEVGKTMGVNLVLNNANERDTRSVSWSGFAGPAVPSHWNELVLAGNEAEPSPAPSRPGTGLTAVQKTTGEPQDIAVDKTGCGCQSPGRRVPWRLFEIIRLALIGERSRR